MSLTAFISSARPLTPRLCLLLHPIPVVKLVVIKYLSFLFFL